MAFTDLTSTSSVRAALGVSERELRDQVLQNPIYMTMLTESLHSIHVDLFDTYIIVSAIVEASRTRTQQRFVDLIQTYSAYHIAVQCLGSVAMFAPLVIKDDRTEVQRTDDPYKHLRTDLVDTLAALLRSLAAVYGLIVPDSIPALRSTRINIVIAPLAVNPVTG